MMENFRLKVLLLTSRPMSHSAHLGADVREALEMYGCKVETMTFEGNISNLDRGMLPIKNKQSIWGKLINLFRVKDRNNHRYVFNNDIVVVNPREDLPVVSATQIVDALKGRRYDFVLTLFWQDMLTSSSLLAIYNRLKVPIIVYMVDMAPVTGGCIYPHHCLRYMMECGMCPGLASSEAKDQSHKNWLIKNRNYNNINIAMLCNAWQRSIVAQTNLLDKERIYWSRIIISPDRFVPLNREECQSYFGISSCANIFLARSTREPSKGFSTLVCALNEFYEGLEVPEKNDVLLVLIGDKGSWYERMIHMPVLNLGMLTEGELIKVYSAVDVFLSPSLNDAGPSMVNQSQMCGVPTISFNVGTAIDAVEHRKNGYIAKNFCCHDFARGLLWYYHTTPQERAEMKELCRLKAKKLNSPVKFASNVIDAYYDIMRRSESKM